AEGGRGLSDPGRQLPDPRGSGDGLRDDRNLDLRAVPDRAVRQPVRAPGAVRAVRLPDPVDLRRVPGVLALPAGRRHSESGPGLDPLADGQSRVLRPALPGRDLGAHLMAGRLTVWGASQLLRSEE